MANSKTATKMRHPRSALNAELRYRRLPLRAVRSAAVGAESRIEFEHIDGVRGVICEADGSRLYILQQKLGRNGERLTEHEERQLRAAWAAVHALRERALGPAAPERARERANNLTGRTRCPR